MSTAEERFQAMMAKRKKEKEEKVELKETKKIDKIVKRDIKEIFPIEDEVFGDLTEDRELIEFLKLKSLEILKIQANNIIMIGKNLTEVFEELGRKGSPDGIYLKYLEFNGYKKDTALRLRKRYELFKSVENESLKQIIAIIPVKSMELLYKEKTEKLKMLEEKKDNLTYNEAIKIINTIEIKNNIIEEKNNININFNFEKIENLYRKINEEYSKLNDRKKEKLNKLLLEIEKILN